MVLKPNAHTILSLLLKFFSDLCSSGCEQRKTRVYTQLRSSLFPVAVTWTKMNVLSWCVAFVTSSDSVSDLWKSAVSSYGLFTSRVLVIVGSSFQSHEGSGCRSDWTDPVSGPQADNLTQPMIKKKTNIVKDFVPYRYLVQPQTQKHNL